MSISDKKDTLSNPSFPVKYIGTAFPNAPKPEFLFPADGGALMAAQTFGIDALYKALFAKLKIRIPQPLPENNWGKLVNGFVESDSPDGHSGDPNNALSDKTLRGVPVYGKIILGDESGTNIWTDAQGRTGSYKTIELDCAICDVSFNSELVVTKIAGLPFSVKEFISSGDNDVTITGIYCSTPDVAPMDFIINLGDLLSAPVAIPVQNYYLNALNIYWIVCTPGCQMPQEQGGYSYQKFTIKALSDVPASTMLP